MSLKDNYEKPKIELIRFTATDLITTSGGNDSESIGTGSGNKAEDGWTPIGW